MKIHHYTSIENLALILKNKTIRFSCLNSVDDQEEASMISAEVNVSRYTYVSCWTKNKEESIPLWKMYTGRDMKGVRITMDVDMFRKYNLPSGEFSGFHVNNPENKKSILPIVDIINESYFILPTSLLDDSIFFREIIYVDNLQEKISSYVRKKTSESNIEYEIALKEIGTYKHKRWEFQDECRFLLTIYPREGSDTFDETANKIVEYLYKGIYPPLSYYDLKLSDNAMNNIEITLGPLRSPSEQIIVQALADKYAPSALIKESELRDKITK